MCLAYIFPAGKCEREEQEAADAEKLMSLELMSPGDSPENPGHPFPTSSWQQSMFIELLPWLRHLLVTLREISESRVSGAVSVQVSPRCVPGAGP